MNEDSWLSRHSGKLIFLGLVLGFVGIKTGYIDKGDIRVLVHDISTIVAEFKDYLLSLFK